MTRLFLFARRYAPVLKVAALIAVLAAAAIAGGAPDIWDP